MKELGAEVLLRLSKLVAATVLGVIIYLLAVGPARADPSLELALLSWLCGAAAVLLVESSPI